ncbi:hypothetical protein D9615_001548 [Tricholomella constricta]|uniref:Uncharacterized protein n=1 Tax=Tricholomella constricta TaxID=117010 RepID=A0A8H5HNI1_9AGAR|nr:hypothetical protein D9615_001548 [Tricholomella constricta]
MANQHHNTQRLSKKVFITIFYPSLIFLPFLPEIYTPIESPFWQHMLRLATCFTLMTLCSKILHNPRFQIVSTVVETIALLGALFMPPNDPAFEANPFGNPDNIPYEPYMVLDEWVGSPGNGWALSILARFIAYVVQVSWRIIMREQVTFPVLVLIRKRLGTPWSRVFRHEVRQRGKAAS